MHTRQVGRIAEVLQKYLGPEAAQEIAEALGADTQEIDHYGPIKVRRSLPYKDRGYSPDWNPDTMLRPVPPVKPPVITDACLTLANQPVDKSDRAGENGFAFDLPQGIWRNLGESWLLKHAYVVEVGAVEDGDPDTLPNALDSTYVYADCLECGDSKGRNLSDMPVRIFCDNCGSLPSPGQIIRYLRDTNGLAWTFPCTAVASSMISDPSSSSSSSSSSSLSSTPPSSSSSNPSDSSSGPSDPSSPSSGSSGSGSSSGDSGSSGQSGSSSGSTMCPLTVQVDIAGVANRSPGSSGDCGTCATLYNGTFVIDTISPGDCVAAGGCAWAEAFLDHDCTGYPSASHSLSVTWTVATSKIRVEISNGNDPSSPMAVWELTQSIGCPPASGTYNLSLVTENDEWHCDASSATCSVTIS